MPQQPPLPCLQTTNLTGILYALLHVPDLDAAVPGAAEDMAGALRYVLTLECDAEGRPGGWTGDDGARLTTGSALGSMQRDGGLVSELLTL